MGFKDDNEALRLENEELKKNNDELELNFKNYEEKSLKEFKVKDEEIINLKKDIESLEKIPKHKLIKLLNKELDQERTRFTTDFLAGIELLTRSIKNLGGGE